jgi:hypothetical protein
MAVNSNARQRIPDLFVVIMGVDEKIDVGRACCPIDFKAMKELKARKAELRRAAEIALSWNHNKGNTK